MGGSAYQVFFRSTANDFDTIFTLIAETDVYLPKPPGVLFVSVAAVDENGVESLFSREILPSPTATEEISAIPEENQGVRLLQNRPNPFDESTIISFWVEDPLNYQEAYVGIFDLNGQLLKKLPTQIRKGMNEVLYFHGYNTVGTFVYSLIIDGQVIDSKRMIFAN